jgi:hypothetical protein
MSTPASGAPPPEEDEEPDEEEDEPEEEEEEPDDPAPPSWPVPRGRPESSATDSKGLGSEEHAREHATAVPNAVKLARDRTRRPRARRGDNARLELIQGG